MDLLPDCSVQAEGDASHVSLAPVKRGAVASDVVCITTYVVQTLNARGLGVAYRLACRSWQSLGSRHIRIADASDSCQRRLT